MRFNEIKSSTNETVNKSVFRKPFNKTKEVGKYLLVAQPGRLLIHQKITDPSDQFRIEAHLGKNTIGWVNFEIANDHLEALDLWVDPKHRRKGLATAMYKFAKELGNDIMPSSKQTALGKAFWSEKSPVDENQLNQQTTLNDLYKGDFPDKDEIFWDYVRPGELDKKLTIKTLSKHNLFMLLLSQYRVEHLDEILDMLDMDQKRILKKYKNDPNLSNKIILISDDRIIDGNHRALAAAFKGVPIKYVDLAELEEQDIDENNDLPSFRRSLANAVRGKVSQMQADAAIAKAKGEFKWNEGDIIYSPKTGKTYTIAGLRVIKNRPMYYYSCEGNEERGMFYADLAHKNLIKISSGPTEQDVSENSNGSLSAEAYKEHLLKTLPQIMGLFAKTGKGWMPSEEQMLAAVETGYQVMKRTGDVKQAGAAIGHEINTLYKAAQKDVAEDAIRHNSHDRIKYGDLILDYKIDGANVDVRAIIDDKQVGYVIFLRDGKLLIPDDLAVDEEYRGHGIAKKMYDWVKSLPQGFRIIRSGIQTTMGKRFWDKNRGESGNVWEEDVAETFDQPYKVKSKKRDFGEIEMSTKLPDGSNLNIVFAQYVNRNNEKFTEVDFYRDETQEVTGEGDAQRIFATVINAITRFVKKYKPQILKFSASVFPGAYDNQSRVNLYNRLVQRYAAPLGYDVSIKGQGDVVEYSLSRREDMVEYPVDEAKKRRRKKNQASRSITTGWWSGYYGDNSSGGEDGGGE